MQHSGKYNFVSKLEMEEMQTNLYQQAKMSLRKILQSKEQPFDEEFRKNFLTMSHDRLSLAYSEVQMEQWRNFQDVTISSPMLTTPKRARTITQNHSLLDLNEVIKVEDSSDEEATENAVEDKPVVQIQTSNEPRQEPVEHVETLSLGATSSQPQQSYGNVEKHQCNICKKIFKKRHALTRHMHFGHNMRDEFLCVGCRMPFQREADKTAHERACKIRRYECYLCKQYFTKYSGRMANHLRTHSGDKPFRCEVCYKRFVSKNNLRIHSNTACHASHGRK